MKKLIEVNVEDYKTSFDKITINIKNIEIEEINTIIKCFKNLEDVNSLEAKRINLIKLQKSVFLNLPNLHVLDLRDNRLEKFSKNFINLKNLRILKLDDNCLTYFPSFLTKLENLEYLSLSQNNITFIPSSIQYMQKLKTFKLSNNKINCLPIEFGLLKSLESLFIDANHFTEIPTTLCYLKHLSELSFEWLEFVEPQFNKIIKDNIGKTIISLIRNSLQELIKQNILYCDFITFVEKNSNPTNEEKKIENKERGYILLK
jgi:Leucine-rich repeat (LRR) protein